MEQKEKDYQIAVEIGKMLLEKNKEQGSKIKDLTRDLEDAVCFLKVRRIKVTSLSCLKKNKLSQNYLKK